MNFKALYLLLVVTISYSNGFAQELSAGSAVHVTSLTNGKEKLVTAGYSVLDEAGNDLFLESYSINDGGDKVFLQSIGYSVSTAGNIAFCGPNAPYYHVANRQGLASVSPNSGYLRGIVTKRMNPYKKFDYGAGIDLAGALGFSSPFVIQQAYGELQFHCLDLMIGSKQYWSEMKNPRLSSGGTVWSGNARPIPQVRLGIFDFTEFPWTNGWLQVKLDLSYGRYTDDRYMKDRFVEIPGWYRTTGVLYHQKKIFFRSKESKRFVVTLGGEFAAQFGGDKYHWSGEGWFYTRLPARAADFWNIFIQGKGDGASTLGDQAYYYGNSLGAWHGVFEYKFRNTSRLKGYFEWYFDDASGMGKLNGWDGLWGMEYNFAKKGFISDVVFEYLQTTNQGGPIHWNPDDESGKTTVTEGHASGADNYYNNFYYNAWSHWGMTAGTPLILSPAYNGDNYLNITNNRVRAVHLGISGCFAKEFDYRLLASYRRCWGTPFVPLPKPLLSTSAMLEVIYTPQRLKGWSFLASCAFDAGTLYGNNCGLMLCLRKAGTLFKY